MDVDAKKIERGFYTNNDFPQIKIPIVHFTALLRRSENSQEHDWVEHYSHITKKKCENNIKSQRIFFDRKRHDANEDFKNLPVVVCVAMYRTNGALENNVKSIGRQEGIDLWHFS